MNIIFFFLSCSNMPNLLQRSLSEVLHLTAGSEGQGIRIQNILSLSLYRV